MNNLTYYCRCSSILGLGILVCCAMLVTFSRGNTALAYNLPLIHATDIMREIADGKTVELTEVKIDGDLDLRELEIVHRPIRCNRCVFSDSVLAPNVTFKSIVDLGGSAFEDPVDFSGAVFESALLFRPAGEKPTRFLNAADFSYADFHETVSFEAVEFEENAEFTAARFADDAFFTNADFNQAASFDDARFGGSVSFSSQSDDSHGASGPGTELVAEEGLFKSRATFRRAAFKGHTDFRLRRFEGPAIFEGATFADKVDFSQALFAGAETNFNSVGFEQSASFIAVIFNGKASYTQAASRGPLEFDFARFHNYASFFRLSSTGLVSMREVAFHNQAIMNYLSAAEFVMDIEDVRQINSYEIQMEILSLIKNSAQQRGDLGLANRAEYTRLSLQNRALDGPVSLFEFVVVQGFFGYFVRPLHPLVSLLAFVGIGWTARSARYLWDSGALTWVHHQMRGGMQFMLSGLAQPLVQSSSPRASDASGNLAKSLYSGTLQVERHIAGILGALATTFAVVFRIKPDIEAVDTNTVLPYMVAGLRLTEFLTYKILTVAFLLGLGNSNPTIHELIDAIL